MSRVNPYVSITKRTFGSALLHMLETDYGLLGGRRILQPLVEDIEGLLAEFYPESSGAGSGTLRWTCTADEGRKATAGKPTEEYQTVTVHLPLVTMEDLAARMQGRHARGKRRTQAKERDKTRLARIVQAAAEQGGLLTIAEMSVLLNKSYEATRVMAREWEAEHGATLPFKGYVMDQGSSPTHKREIVALFEAGLQPPDIARETQHAVESVERYLQDYERVRMLLPQLLSVVEISSRDWTRPESCARICSVGAPVSPGVVLRYLMAKHGDAGRCPKGDLVSLKPPGILILVCGACPSERVFRIEN